ncbi:MAG: phage minor capsid protein, partial [Ruminococcus sp.]|nr:phage minor capsid protein [Ruminococcus sp.]
MCNPAKQLNGKVTEMLKTANSDGYANQEAEILEAVRNGFKGYDLKPSQTASAAFFRTNEKLNALIKATVSDLKRAETAILRMSNDKYRKAIFNAQVFANTGAGTYEKAVDMACRDMLRAGLNCVEYKNGARHTLSDYAEMALRTADKRAYLYGEGQKRQEWGIAAVIVNNRRGGCPHCAPYVGRVFIDDVYSGGNKSDGKYPLLSEAIRGGLFHPRCKDSTSTYFEGITEAKPVTKEELAEMDRREKLEQKQSYCKNEAKKNRRIAEHSLDPDNQKTYIHRAEVFEQKAAAVKKLQTDKITKKSSAVDSWESKNYKNSTETGLLITSDGKKIDFGGTDHHVTGRADDI